MSTTTTSASSLSAIPCATVAPTLPPPTTVTFVFIEASPRCEFCRAIILNHDACRFLQNSKCDRSDDEKVGEGAAAGGLPRRARRCVARARGRLFLRIAISAQGPEDR